MVVVVVAVVVLVALAEGSLEIKLRTIWIDEKAEVGRVREEKRKTKIREEKDAEEDIGMRRGSKITKYCVFNGLYRHKGVVYPTEKMQNWRIL